MTLSRRDALRAGLAVAASSLALTTAASPVAAAHDGAKPDHVTLRYDEAELEAYRPIVYLPPATDIRPSTWYAWTASSPEYEYDVHVYWLFYHTQTAAVAAHRPDREPVYVYVDPEVGDVREVVYSAWHWMAFRWTTPLVYEPSDTDGRHVQLQADRDYHHYYQTDRVGELFGVEPLGTTDGDAFSGEDVDSTTFESWVRNSWEDSLAVGAAQHPEVMRFRESWWADGAERSHRWFWGLQLRLASLGISNDRVVDRAPQSDLAD